MNAAFIKTGKGTNAYIQKSIRVDGKSTTVTIKKLGLLEDIRREQGCENPRQWVIDLAKKMTEDEKAGKAVVELEFHPSKDIAYGENPLKIGGDFLLRPLYRRLGLDEICKDILKSSRAKYDLAEIIRTLVMGRILFPASKSKTLAKSADLLFPPDFKEKEMFRALTLVSDHTDFFQSRVYKRSKDIIERRDRVIYYDCTNYYFEIEDNDKDTIIEDTGEFIPGLRKRGKSKENRPNPIVQMGMFMDMDGIPLAFIIFPGNESEQTSLKPLEEKLNRQFDMTDYIVSTDCGLGSEENRRYNMAEGRDYICVQSLPGLKKESQDIALDSRGWRIAYCRDKEHKDELEQKWGTDGIFNLEDLWGIDKEEADRESDACLRQVLEENRLKKIAALLKDVTFYKEVLVTKEYKYEDAEWLRQKRESPDKDPVDEHGNKIPHEHTLKREERLIVTYSHDFACFLRHKREERLKISQVIVKARKKKPRQSQQSPMKYVKTRYIGKDGKTAVKMEMSIDGKAIEQEARFDGFYAYGTSLEDDGVDILKIRSLHHEIEHLFRTTKTHLDARPVYLSRQDRIRSHFLICFLSMVILKILQKQLMEANKEFYASEPLPIDRLIDTLRDFKFGTLPRGYYQPMFRRTPLTDQLQSLLGINLNNEIISGQKMRTLYKRVNKG